jgi:endonuclease/exonuclease/phosphatase family metal-dependent hydrolase
MIKAIVVFVLLCCSLASAAMRVMTYNIQVASVFTPSWENRKCNVVDYINYFQPDILCLQEATVKQIDDLLAEYKEGYPHFEGYSYVAFGTHKERYHNAILYSPAKINVVTSGVFDLGGWGRGCVWALCFDKEDGSLFYVYNTHLATAQIFRAAQAKKIVDMINHRTHNLPVVLCGDLNADRDSKVLQILSSVLVDFGPDLPTFKNRKIDYIMGYGSHALESHVVMKEEYGSDHYPVAVVVDVEFWDGISKQAR